jgi:hypothetical protein
MAGAKGRSGGRNKKSIRDHLLAGSYRRDRHGPLPENVLPMPTTPTTVEGQSVDPEWSPPRADVVSLGVKSKRFLSDWHHWHVCSQREGILVLAAARALDEAERWRRRSRRATGPTQARCARLVLAFEKQFAAVLSQLKVS